MFCRDYGGCLFPDLPCDRSIAAECAGGSDRKLTELVDSAMTAWGVNPVLHSLVIDGIFNGVGSVLSFLPIIVTLFFFLSILEDSGYMARVAFVMDKLLRKIGLSGRSIVPMLVGFGCTVPGVMASRTLPSERDRKMTILLTPFMSCSAKLPIYAFFTAAFFPEIQCPCDGSSVFRWYLHGCPDGDADAGNFIPGGSRSVCHGASKLPHAGAKMSDSFCGIRQKTSCSGHSPSFLLPRL